MHLHLPEIFWLFIQLYSWNLPHPPKASSQQTYSLYISSSATHIPAEIIMNPIYVCVRKEVNDIHFWCRRGFNSLKFWTHTKGCQIPQRTCPLSSFGCLRSWRLASSSFLPLVERRIGSLAVRQTWSVAARRISLWEAARRSLGPLWKAGRAVFPSLPIHRSAEWGFPPSIAAMEINYSRAASEVLRNIDQQKKPPNIDQT